MGDHINHEEIFSYSPPNMQEGYFDEDFMKLILKYDQEQNYDKLEEVLW